MLDISRNVFFNEFFIWTCGNGFYVWWKQYSFIQGFGYLGVANFFKRNLIHARRNWFSGQWKLIFSIFQILLLVKNIFRFVETYFWTNFSFRMVETDFLSCGNRFLSFCFFYKWNPSLKLMAHFLRKDFIPANRKWFSIQWKLLSFIPCFLPVSGNHQWN